MPYPLLGEYMQKRFSKNLKRIIPWPFSKRFLNVSTDLTVDCNLMCSMCVNALIRKNGGAHPKTEVSGDEFKSLFREMLPYAKTLSLSCAGEPLMSTGYLDAIGCALSEGVPEISIVTNATLLTEDVSRKIIESRLDRLTISLDSHRKDVYEKIRVGADFDEVVENIRRLNRLKKKTGSNTPELRFVCVLMKSNICGVKEYLEFIKDLGAREVDFRHLVVYAGSGLEGESLSNYRELANKHIAQIEETCRKLSITAYKPLKFRLKTSENNRCETPGTAKRKCKIPETNVYVNIDGFVLPCPFWDEKPFGNLNEKGFWEIWESEYYKSLRQDASKGKFNYECCRQCHSLGSGSVDDEKSYKKKL